MKKYKKLTKIDRENSKLLKTVKGWIFASVRKKDIILDNGPHLKDIDLQDHYNILKMRPIK